ncbi:DUF4291 domain-containing protein [Hymenobacter sp. B1770]|uniref:DUF4291 domain-containing protein n=1 Tax=Hymenobacter sp. B1770 TaxID=1718788 RepID=UPI003CEDD96D
MLIRAAYDEHTLTVYQAYHPRIALPAVAEQRLALPGFKVERMTWIKPSFLWMMYRSGWATKENQERVLALKIKRTGLDWALQHACLSHFNATAHPSSTEWKEHLQAAPVRIQWDPERDVQLNPLPQRAIQIGLSGEAVARYVHEWVEEITDVTALAHEIQTLVQARQIQAAVDRLPKETVYPTRAMPHLLLEHLLLEQTAS